MIIDRRSSKVIFTNKMKLRILRLLMTIMLGVSVEAGLDVEDLIARGYTCSLADTRYHLFKLTEKDP